MSFITTIMRLMLWAEESFIKPSVSLLKVSGSVIE